MAAENPTYVKYQLIEPITTQTGENETTEVEISPDGLSNYFNSTYNFVLILIAITAVFYLVYGGMVYLTTDIANKQKQGKEIIVRVITGLIFVFTVWVVLNSINPNILNNRLNFAIVNSVSSTPRGTSTSVGPGPTISPGVANPCTEGFVSVGGISVCKSIEIQVKNMLDVAAKDGIRLSGTGSRPISKQIDLRRKNCGPTDYDIYQRPSRECTPQTAIPGTSMHEKGLAIDFTGINSSDSPGYKWLVQNASRWGFSGKVPAERWHWSTTGY